jgi:acyl-[acyl-carrier-protein]-phospholipid O-acyltransferase/long-chain-fatty-acid--[acyl-carrier-protein] ligase
MENAAAPRHTTLLGAEHLPLEGFLLVPNTLPHADAVRLGSVLTGRTVVYVIEEGAALAPEMKAHLEKDGVTTLVIVPKTTDVAAYRGAIKDAVKSGAVVIYLPALASTVPAPLTTVSGVTLDFILRAEVPVVPLYVHHPADVALSIESIRAEETTLAFGKPLYGEDLSLAGYQESLFSLSEQCFSRHAIHQTHLARAIVRGFKKHGTTNHVVDGKEEKILRFDKVFAAALALSSLVKKETKKKRVGIILPPGLAGLIANVAVLLAGKTPVNLNFTASRQAVEFAIRQSDMDRFLTADLFVRKMQSFPWPPLKQLVLLERVMPAMKGAITRWFIVSKILPAWALCAWLGLPKRGGHEEATLLFTSGSSGDPKGVVLSHRNLLSNVTQFSTRLGETGKDVILGSLPLFHSFGCTVTLWFPVIEGVNLVTYPTPLETKKLAELVEKYSVTLMLATPTFLRGYLRGVTREQLASVRMVITGAEKLPLAIAEAFETKFGKRVFEGYGLTETSPVSNVNLIDPMPPAGQGDGYTWLPSYRLGSTGQFLPGMAVRITHPESGAPQSIHQSGMLWLKGPNIFEGYLKDEKRTADVMDKDGWFCTGDIGRVDLDGFLYIEGRLSRFSKIAGEMVPHETVEDTLIKALGLENENARRIAIVGVPDIEKGEALVLLSTLPGNLPEMQEILDLRYRLLDRGVPALWIPKRMIRVSDIPILASGKLDIQACEKIARG